MFWTLKEAYTKATGEGIVADLSTIEFSNLPPPPSLSSFSLHATDMTVADLTFTDNTLLYTDTISCARSGTSLSTWRFELWLSPTHVLALACSSPPSTTPTPVIPLNTNTLLASIFPRSL
ncbi:uncharacterized protein V1518DRAFT_408459 [Limtongia smithiae]|uniref:uncharacterized protein n=1 Tax=Limtongia smithiae TaxID=1125753 RepID=UPI0034CFC6CE